MPRHITVGLHIGHDRSVSIVESGRLIAHLAEERMDRNKHSHSVSFPRKALFAILNYCNLSLSDVSAFGISYSFVDIASVLPGLAEDLRHQFQLGDVPIFGVSHHFSHALSAFHTSPFDAATVFVADGAGDLCPNGKVEAETAYSATQFGLSLLWSREQDIPASYADRRTFFRVPYLPSADLDKQISIGRKYEQLTYLLGFGWGQSGKTMGLAPYGKALFELPARATDPTTGFDLRMSDLIDDLEGAKKRSGEPFDLYVRNRRADIAATVQKGLEDVALSMVSHLHTLHPSDNLCLAGGLFLNCVLNHKILSATPFKNVYIVPACGDDGQSVGAALHAYHQLYGPAHAPQALSAYLGPGYSMAVIEAELENAGLRYERHTDEALLDEVAGRLRQGLICGLLRGRSEMGPRALGHRSILAAPTLPGVRDHLNHYVKRREGFRPFAPMVTAEAQFRYFDLRAPSRFMLFTAAVKAPYREMLPGVSHVDGSARVQAVAASDDPFLHALLSKMEECNGHPILLNTSFNVAGEPIVETPRDAISSFLRSNLDFVVLENYLVVKAR
ncbi:MAG TPA: carbamoyltransferase C-terminal domain-containing protein [Undibacterium sp.]|jgi:carbamoyltransferase|nr:carbamoyltransferase C-terminal domain-containing protein [Undibacterium sp.]